MTPELQSLNDRICILIGRVQENGENLQRELDALKALADTGTAQNTTGETKNGFTRTTIKPR